MKSSTATLAGLALVASMAGCAMCQNPFDYCAPVIEPDGCPNCDFGARRGSQFHPMAGTGNAERLTPRPADADKYAPAANNPGDARRRAAEPVESPPAYEGLESEPDTESFR